MSLAIATLAQRHPRLIDTAIRLDRVPPLAWLALQALALLPVWIWMGQRLRDGSDDPLGPLALAALAALVWRQRRALRAAPRPGWLLSALLASMAATAAHSGIGTLAALPPLACGLIAVLGVACALIAFLPGRVAALPVIGLSVLALPLLSSLQFYAGYPLRVITAEVSRWLLMPGFSVTREGSSLLVDGRLIIVDAPCSGVQMAWFVYFSACVAALWAGRDSRGFAARLPLVGLCVLAGNIVRNSVLVAFEGAGHPLAPWAHDALGLVLLALTCAAAALWMARRPSS